ncbi:MAG: hypothetical protein PWQ55_1870 [Chloroflexota bacterium]|nr:hypothetical protein [Chloroflexota bacterium]
MKIMYRLYSVIAAGLTFIFSSAFINPATLQTVVATPDEGEQENPQIYPGWTYEDMDVAVPMFHDGTYPQLKDGLEAAVRSYRVEIPPFNFCYLQFTTQVFNVYASVSPMDYGGGAYEDVCSDTMPMILDPDLFQKFMNARYLHFVEVDESWDKNELYETVLFITTESDEYGGYTAFWPQDGGLTIVEADGSVQYFYADPAEWANSLDWEMLSPAEQELVNQGYTMIWRGLGDDGESVGRANYHDLETFLGVEKAED